MNKILMLIAMLVTTVSLFATDYTTTRKSSKGAVYTDRHDIEAILSKPAGTVKKTPIAKEGEGEEYVTLHVKFVYPDHLVPVYAAYDENDLGWSIWWEGEDKMDLQIPVSGIYKGDNILVGAFEAVDKTTESHADNSYFVFVDLPELKDGIEVVFDANKIDRTYKVEFLNKDGKPFTLKRQMYDTETTEYVCEGEGDLEQGFGGMWIGGGKVLQKAGNLFFLLNRSYSDGREDLKLLTPPTISTNALPAGIEVSAMLTGENNGVEELILISTPSTTIPGTLRNNAEDYMNGTFLLTGTPIGNREEWLKIGLDLSCNGWRSFGIKSHYPNFIANDSGLATIKLTTCIAVSETPGVGMQCEADVELEDRTNGGLVIAPPIIPDHAENRLNYIQINNTFGPENGLYSRGFENWEQTSIFKNRNPHLPTLVSDYTGIIGNCCPAFVSLGMWPKINGVFPAELMDLIFDAGFLNASYVGRNGEAMTVDAYQAEIIPEVEGDMQIYNFRMDNVLVDGDVAGSNSAVLGCNFNLEDWVPPTVQTVFFTNSSGYVTDRFDTADDATVTIYAGDFEYVYNDTFTEDMMAVNQLADITVEYAPYQSEDFMDLKVIENAEKFWMPGYGYCYEGSLTPVSALSTNGWFDLRVTVKDESGNWQRQTISPAFYIRELSGVKSVETPIGGLYVLDGRIVCASACDISVFTIDGCRVENANLAPGVYVVRANGTAHKISVR